MEISGTTPNAPKFIRPLFIAAAGILSAHAETPAAAPGLNVDADFAITLKTREGCIFEPVKSGDPREGLYRINAFTQPKVYRGFPFISGDVTISFKDGGDFLVRNGIVRTSPAIEDNAVIEGYLKRHRTELYDLARKAREFLKRCSQKQNDLAI